MATKKTTMAARRLENSPPLSAEEIKDIDDFYAHPEEHKVGTINELLAELHSEDCDES